MAGEDSEGRRDIGRRGEEAAAVFLRQRGLKILERNFRTRYGEIDLICLDGPRVVFVEVKTRTSHAFGPGSEAVNRVKQRRLSKAAQHYLLSRRWQDKPARFDVLSINLVRGEPHLEYLMDAFDLVSD
ncbi:MAG: YraN family protein [Thermodesulfobacteriota bacterium]